MFRNEPAKQTAKKNVRVLKRRHTAQTFAHVTMSSNKQHQSVEKEDDDYDAMPVPILDENSWSDSDQIDSDA